MSATVTRTALTFAAASADISATNTVILELFGYSRGACELGAELLAQALILRGYTPEVCYGFYESGAVPPEEHCWVECDGVTLDPTCDQFGGDPLLEDEYCYSGGGDEDEEGTEIELERSVPSPERATLLLDLFTHTPEQRVAAAEVADRYRLPWPPPERP